MDQEKEIFPGPMIKVARNPNEQDLNIRDYIVSSRMVKTRPCILCDQDIPHGNCDSGI